MKPTDILKAEHRGIEQMLEVVRAGADRLARGEEVPPELFPQAVDFFRDFADRCHHGKEERLLFARLADRGVPVNGGPIGVMLAEHEQGRGHIRGMQEALDRLARGDRGAVTELAGHAEAYVELLRAHIQKENNVLFPMADRLLSAEEQAELEREFERVEREEIGEGVHERYHEMIHELSAQVLAR